MKINNNIYEYATNNKSQMKSLNQSSKNAAGSHKNSASPVGANQSDTVTISEEARNISQLNRENAQHLWVEVNGTKVSTIVTPDGVWIAKNGTIGRDAYEMIDTSNESSGLSQSAIQELQYIGKMLAHMPSGQLSMSPASYGRSIMESAGITLSDITGIYSVHELQELRDTGTNMARLPTKPSAITSEQLQWLRGEDMMKSPDAFQVKSLKEILQETANAFTTVYGENGNSKQHIQAAESAFSTLLENNRGFLANQLMQLKSAGNSANPALLQQARLESEKQIDLFGNNFLSSFQELGAEEAFALAWTTLQGQL